MKNDFSLFIQSEGGGARSREVPTTKKPLHIGKRGKAANCANN